MIKIKTLMKKKFIKDQLSKIWRIFILKSTTSIIDGNTNAKTVQNQLKRKTTSAEKILAINNIYVVEKAI
jgi:hypothetical protein